MTCRSETGSTVSPRGRRKRLTPEITTSRRPLLCTVHWIVSWGTSWNHSRHTSRSYSAGSTSAAGLFAGLCPLAGLQRRTVNQVEQRAVLRLFNQPRAANAGQVNGAQFRIALVNQQRIVGQERQLVVAVVDALRRPDLFLSDGVD